MSSILKIGKNAYYAGLAVYSAVSHKRDQYSEFMAAYGAIPKNGRILHTGFFALSTLAAFAVRQSGVETHSQARVDSAEKFIAANLLSVGATVFPTSSPALKLGVASLVTFTNGVKFNGGLDSGIASYDPLPESAFGISKWMADHSPDWAWFPKRPFEAAKSIAVMNRDLLLVIGGFLTLTPKLINVRNLSSKYLGYMTIADGVFSEDKNILLSGAAIFASTEFLKYAPLPNKSGLFPSLLHEVAKIKNLPLKPAKLLFYGACAVGAYLGIVDPIRKVIQKAFDPDAPKDAPAGDIQVASVQNTKPESSQLSTLTLGVGLNNLFKKPQNEPNYSPTHTNPPIIEHNAFLFNKVINNETCIKKYSTNKCEFVQNTPEAVVKKQTIITQRIPTNLQGYDEIQNSSTPIDSKILEPKSMSLNNLREKARLSLSSLKQAAEGQNVPLVENSNILFNEQASSININFDDKKDEINKRIELINSSLKDKLPYSIELLK